jgi:hypothetical protein
MLLSGEVILDTPWKKGWESPTDSNKTGRFVQGIGKSETVDEVKKYRGNVSVEPGEVKVYLCGDIKPAEIFTEAYV